ncbi:hypothetical protein QAD02_011186 [Eretmocerus hayati]|uniref:Uncharacterized protein n=1 Tax=Eretmocerus hayati TaxID=131215 RepID=A0ACC2NVT4_9HYME|nr:hypothetical protein QAD02_011186 [Eretmocerus hayati]
MAHGEPTSNEILNFIQNTQNPRLLFSREGNLDDIEMSRSSAKPECIQNVQRTRQRNFCSAVKIPPEVEKTLFTKQSCISPKIDTQYESRGYAASSQKYQECDLKRTGSRNNGKVTGTKEYNRYSSHNYHYSNNGRKFNRTRNRNLVHCLPTFEKTKIPSKSFCSLMPSLFFEKTQQESCQEGRGKIHPLSVSTDIFQASANAKNSVRANSVSGLLSKKIGMKNIDEEFNKFNKVDKNNLHPKVIETSSKISSISHDMTWSQAKSNSHNFKRPTNNICVPTRGTKVHQKHKWNHSARNESEPCFQVTDTRNSKKGTKLIEDLDDEESFKFIISESTSKCDIKPSESIRVDSEKFKKLTFNSYVINRNQFYPNLKNDDSTHNSTTRRIEIDDDAFVFQKWEETDFPIHSRSKSGITDSDEMSLDWSSSLDNSWEIMKPHSPKHEEFQRESHPRTKQSQHGGNDGERKNYHKNSDTIQNSTKSNFDEYSPEFFSKYFKKLRNKNHQESASVTKDDKDTPSAPVNAFSKSGFLNKTVHQNSVDQNELHNASQLLVSEEMNTPSSSDSSHVSGLNEAQAEMRKMLTTLKDISSCMEQISLDETETCKRDAAKKEGSDGFLLERSLVQEERKDFPVGPAKLSDSCNFDGDEESTIYFQYCDDGTYNTISQIIDIPDENEQFGVQNISTKPKPQAAYLVPYKKIDFDDFDIDFMTSSDDKETKSSVIIEELNDEIENIEETGQMPKTIKGSSYPVEDDYSYGYEDVDPDEKYDIVGWEDTPLCGQIAYHFGLQDLYHKVRSSSAGNHGLKIR